MVSKLLPMVLVFATSTAFSASADFVGSSGSITVDHTTAIPGNTLKAGSYSLSITEQIADRMIVRIDSTTSTNHAIFLGVPTTPDKMGGGGGAVMWQAGVSRTATLRGYVFPNGNAVEFVYPKADAAALAKDNSASVVAVDPRSEGRVALKSLSQDELQIVNLWLLSLTTTGPDNKTPAVLARRYDGNKAPERAPVVASASPVAPPVTPSALVAKVQAPVAPVPAPVVTGRRSRVVPPTAARAVPPAVPERAVTPAPKVVQAKRAAVAPPSDQVARVETPRDVVPARRQGPALAQLPHTGSMLPLVWIVGLLSVLGAAVLRLGRLLAGVA